MGDDCVYKIIGVCDIFLQINKGKQLFPKRFKHTSNVCINLISMRMFDDYDFNNHFYF